MPLVMTDHSDVRSLQAQVEQLQHQLATTTRERDQAQEKLQRMAELIGARGADKIEHDLRNVMNELGLLRKLLEEEEGH